LKEQGHQRKAFEYYYSLGDKRTYLQVAKKFGISIQSVKLWGRRFSWKKRLSEREVEVARAVAAKSIDSEVSSRSRNKQLIQLALVQLAKAIAEGKVRMNLGDLDRLIRLESFLDQGVDSRHELVIETLKGKTYEELREIVRREIDTLKEIGAYDDNLLLGDGSHEN